METEARKCRVESCDRDAMPQRTLCVGHRERWRAHHDLMEDIPLRDRHGRVPGDVCAVEGCDRPRAPSGRSGRKTLCGTHAARKARTGDVQADKPIRPVHSGQFDVWCDYQTAHTRTANARGRAGDHQCIDCGGPARDWSYHGGARFEFTGIRRDGTRATWSGDPADYDPRCRSCHVRFDAK